MPNTIRYIPGDPSDLLLRQMYHEHESVINNYFTSVKDYVNTIGERPLRDESVNFKIITHIVTCDSLVNTNNFINKISDFIYYAWDVMNSYSTANINYQLLNHDKNLNQLNIAGVNIIDGNDFTQDL